jgi:hypothetical protein
MGIEDDTQMLIPENITVSLGLVQILVNRDSSVCESLDCQKIRFVFESKQIGTHIPVNQHIWAFPLSRYGRSTSTSDQLKVASIRHLFDLDLIVILSNLGF